MCGCPSAAASRVSRWKRSVLNPARSSGGRTFTTTCRPSRVSSATNTRLMPPPPSPHSTRYARPNAACSRAPRSGVVASATATDASHAAISRTTRDPNEPADRRGRTDRNVTWLDTTAWVRSRLDRGSLGSTGKYVLYVSLKYPKVAEGSEGVHGQDVRESLPAA
jgi:hypothetical protein